MTELTFATGNAEKFHIAEKTFTNHGITLLQANLDIDEIQGEDGEAIVLDKVRKAYTAVQRPVVVNDDSWSIPGLKGFPGPYMKSVIHWFTADDFIRLTSSLTDRRAILSQRIAFSDGQQEKVILIEYTGELLPKARGNYGTSWQRILTMPFDKGLSVSEVYDHGIDVSDREVSEGWKAFIAWYQEIQNA